MEPGGSHSDQQPWVGIRSTACVSMLCARQPGLALYNWRASCRAASGVSPPARRRQLAIGDPGRGVFSSVLVGITHKSGEGVNKKKPAVKAGLFVTFTLGYQRSRDVRIYSICCQPPVLATVSSVVLLVRI